MNKFLVITFAVFLFGCSGSVNECGVIESKFIKDGKYFFAVNLSDPKYTGDQDEGGPMYSDAEVSKAIYEMKMAGDDFKGGLFPWKRVCQGRRGRPNVEPAGQGPAGRLT